MDIKVFQKLQVKVWDLLKAKFRTRFDRLWETQHRFPSTASKWGGKLEGSHSWVILKEGNTGFSK